MPFIVGTVGEAAAGGRRRRFDEGNFRGVADYLFETLPGEALGPQALIARQAPGWVLPAHFHMQHQFQVVLRGSGTLGKHALAPGSVHYTSPQSPYGPIVAGDEGLDYFTLRVLTDKGAWYMPESRGVMQPGVPKHQTWGSAADPEVAAAVLIPLGGDGLGAWMWRADVGQTIEADSAPGKSGRFHLVIAGEFRFGDRDLPQGSCVYCTPDLSPRFTAHAPSSQLVVAQFPDHAVDHQVPPELRMAPSPRGTVVSSSTLSHLPGVQ